MTIRIGFAALAAVVLAACHDQPSSVAQSQAGDSPQAATPTTYVAHDNAGTPVEAFVPGTGEAMDQLVLAWNHNTKTAPVRPSKESEGATITFYRALFSNMPIETSALVPRIRKEAAEAAEVLVRMPIPPRVSV